MKRVSYHNHTQRCHHAIGSEEDVIIEAINQKMDEIGISEHMPHPDDAMCAYKLKMSELDDYINSVQKLKIKYADKIKIFVGLECEYTHLTFALTKKLLLEKKLDYLILAQHFDFQTLFYFGNCQNKDDFNSYYNFLEEAAKTGIYSFIAHPDIFLFQYKGFDADCIEISERICELSLKYDLPLEINGAGFRNKNRYPDFDFFRIVGKYGCKVMINSDAHHFKDVYERIDEIHIIANELGLNVIDYLPIRDLSNIN